VKILVINCGSSSIKYQLYEMKKKEVLASGFLEKIGEAASMLFHKRGKKSIQIEKKISNHKQGLRLVVDVLLSKEKGAIKSTSEIFAIGHRVVHGGEDFVESALITDKVIEVIDKYKDLAPLPKLPFLILLFIKLFPRKPTFTPFLTNFIKKIR
jgi:acetate kinase